MDGMRDGGAPLLEFDSSNLRWSMHERAAFLGICAAKGEGFDHHVGHLWPLSRMRDVLERPLPQVLRMLWPSTEVTGATDA